MWDHNKERLYERACGAAALAGDKIWGFGFHWYSGSHFDAVSLTHERFPDKVLIESEFCRGMPCKNEDCMTYAREILGNLNAGANASVDWNMLLDSGGGPYHNRSGGCTAPVMTNARGELVYTPAFHGIAHFARYIKPGDVRIHTSSFTDSVKITAFRHGGSISAVIINVTDTAQNVKIRMRDNIADIKLPPMSVVSAKII